MTISIVRWSILINAFNNYVNLGFSDMDESEALIDQFSPGNFGEQSK